MADHYNDLTRDQLIQLLRKRDLSRRLGLVWERDEIEHERLLESDLPLPVLDPGPSRGKGPWKDLLIEGDNFHALRFLGAAYKGRVKCVYIDPPYNTGTKDFIYNDRYQNKEDAFFNSTWLEFLYRRLSLARDLLREDGVLLVSINDANRAYLELLLEQIWPGGRQGTLVWRNRQGSNADQGCFLSSDHEHVLVWSNPGFKFKGFEKSYEMYSNPDNDPKGDWRSDNLTLGFTYVDRPNLYYPLCDPKTDIWYPANPDGVWRYASKERLKEGQQVQAKPMEDFIALGQIRFPIEQCVVVWETKEALLKAIELGEVPCSGKTPLLRKELPDLDFWVGKKVGFDRPQFKRYKADLRNENQPLSSWVSSTIDKEDELGNSLVSGTNQEGTKALLKQLGDKAFSYPKPPSLLRGLLSQSTGPDDLVLDFFAGSGTTAQAVAELNAEDGGHRACILVSSTEATADEPGKNICRDVAARRLAALGREFAYLRMESYPVGDHGRALSDAAVWTALQLFVAQEAGAAPDDNEALWTRETEQCLLCFARRLDAGSLAAIAALAPPPGKVLLVFSFQPGPLRQRLIGRSDARVEALPDALERALLPASAKRAGGAL
ncbi:MAG TPA: site-specific DNA-methyltransferase [Spirochaetales bacterium]|nr:site-specific DNA-methyltransferase [Spirochaetales bacterium]